MQTDATGTAAAGQDPQGRACPGCGTQNADTADFCWKCYRRFETGQGGVSAGPYAPRQAAGPYAPTQPGAAGPYAVHRPGMPMPPPPGSLSTPRPEARSAGKGIATFAAAAVALAVVGWFLMSRLGGGAPAFPESVAGIPQADVPQLEQLIDLAKEQSNIPEGIDLDLAMYGDPLSPRFALMWMKGDGLGNAQDAFEALSSGLGEGLLPGASGAGQLKVETRDGVTYACASGSDFGVTGPAATLCMWPDDDIFWMVLDFQPGPTIEPTILLAGQANDAIE